MTSDRDPGSVRPTPVARTALVLAIPVVALVAFGVSTVVRHWLDG